MAEKFETRPDQVAPNFGRNMRRVRQSKEIPQRQLAEDTGLSRDAIRRVELGERKAQLDTVMLIVGALGVRPNELLKVEDRPLVPAEEYLRAGSQPHKALAFIRDHPGCSVGDLAGHLDVSIRQAKDIVYRLRKRHSLTARGPLRLSE